MRRTRFQNRVAASSATLPVAALSATLLWFATRTWSLSLPAGWLACALTAALIFETNNENALIRIRTRLTSALFLVGMGAMCSLHPWQAASMAQLCLAASYFVLFRTYQQPAPTGEVFHAFLFLSVGSLWFPQMLCLVPFYFLYMAAFLRCLCFRTCCAGGAGVLLPYWFWAGWCVYTSDFAPLSAHVHGLLSPPLPSWAVLGRTAPGLLAGWGLTTLLAAVSLVHYLRTDYADKIRVRMLCYTLVWQAVVVEVLFLCMPQHASEWLSLLHLTTCFLGAHFFALTSSRAGNVFFVLTLFLYAALAVYSAYECHH